LRLGGRYQPIQGSPSAPGTQLVVARDLVLGRTCFLKLAPLGSVEGGQLQREGALLADLGHPHLVRLIDVVYRAQGFQRGPDVTGFSMEWIDGRPLGLDVPLADRATRLLQFAQLVDAVSYLHLRGVLHLDVKPDNVLVDDRGAVLLDLGSARPLDAGPGEAGGTLGFASPEVLAGQAASPAADLYSLGTVLYRLLTDHPPHGDRHGADLRQAVLVGDVLPVRAVCPSVPRGLARLAESLLRVDTAARPRSALEVLDLLADEGVELQRALGTPPFVGRQDEVSALVERFARPVPGVVDVVGEVGSGRTRLVRRALEAWGQRYGGPYMDLSRADRVDRALHRLALLGGESLPAPDGGAAWAAAVAAQLHRGAAGGPIFLGRWDDLDPDVRVQIEGLLPALVAGGYTVVRAACEASPGVELHRLGPLDDADSSALARFRGVVRPSLVAELRSRSGGQPGPLLRLAERSLSTTARSSTGGKAAMLLAMLPSGLPQVVVDALPAEMQSTLHRGVRTGDVRIDGEARWWSAVPEAEVATAPDLLAVLTPLLVDGAPSSDPLWLARFAVHIGDFDAAQRMFARCQGQSEARRPEIEEVARGLSRHGDVSARLSLVRLLLQDGLWETALELIRAVELDNEEGRVLHVRALRQGGRLDDAEKRLLAAEASAPSAALALERARILMVRRDIDGAHAALNLAEARDHGALASEMHTQRLALANAWADRGRTYPGLDELLMDIEARAERSEVTAAGLSAAARLIARQGDLERSERLLGMAAVAAEAAGQLRQSIGIRLNHGNHLSRMGKGRRARDILMEALQLATRTEAPDLVLRLHYALAEMELRSGRLPAAEAAIAEFRELALNTREQGAQDRAALLHAALQVARGRPQSALDVLANVDAGRLTDEARGGRDKLVARARLMLGDGAEVLSLLASTPVSADLVERATVEALRGRAHLVMGRAHLAQAVQLLPSEPEAMVKQEAGEVLLAASGEDIDPDSFAERRLRLDRAATYLRGGDAARAATLRDRLLVGPGAGLERIVGLTEAMQNPDSFPAALARLVKESLGAHRVLIILRMPGLGLQRAWTELSGAEATGISDEVVNRIRLPDDYWLAADAFADPHLRETSQTVRTFELKSLVAVAIPHLGRAVGALYIDDLYRAGRFRKEDVEILQRMCRSIGHLLPMLSQAGRRNINPEPVMRHGLWFSDANDVEALDDAVALLDGRSECNLLITGPTGAGKSVLARRLARDVLGAVDVEVVVLHEKDPQMLVTQLMGARRGDYTGAVDREGAIQRCIRENRVLFLDEIQNLGEIGQRILLPLLDKPRRFASLTGSTAELPGAFHIVLGTNADLGRNRWKSHFRPDLWYRMTNCRVDLTPISRQGPEVVYQYLSWMLERLGAPKPEELFDATALQTVTNAEWPGNLRQLNSFADNVTQMRAGGRLTVVRREHLPRLMRTEHDGAEVADESFGSADETETDAVVRELVVRHLRSANGRQVEAAKNLRWSPSKLNKWIKREGMADWVRSLKQSAGDREEEELLSR
jgi:transcriptional regulator with GAF, ATPase, and Fis domain/tetratricopeptide (TPR) repeat protein